MSRNAEGAPLRMIGTTADITTIRTLSERLQESVNLITGLTNEVPGLVYQHRLYPTGEAFFPYASAGVREIYELEPEQLAANLNLIDEIIHPDDLPNYRASLVGSARGLTPWELEFRVVLPKQGLRWRQGHAKPSRLRDGSTLWHGFISDVTERKHIETELQVLASMDFLTQLPNRRHFMMQLDAVMARLHRMAEAHAVVLMCDLDHFKTINDRYGHAIGDLVLKHFAAILRDEVRKMDTVGRVGGEEFALVLPEANVNDAIKFAKRVQQRLAETPLVKGDITIAMTVSIGIAVMDVTDVTAQASLSRSDMALYRAKHRGRNRIEVAE